jgi:hypothetical protein
MSVIMSSFSIASMAVAFLVRVLRPLRSQAVIIIASLIGLGLPLA